MKKIIAFPAVVFFVLILFSSCSKNPSDLFTENSAVVPDKVITAKISPGQTHVVPIDDMGNLSIVRQASHFKISQAGVDPKNGKPIYTYTPADGFTGSDEVLLLHKIHTSESSGACNYVDNQGSRIWRTYIAVKITVAN